MDWTGAAQTVGVAIALAIIFGITRLFQRLNTLETKVEPLVEWFRKVSFDAMKLATNPTSQRLMALADKYIAAVVGKRKEKLNPSERQELIDGLLAIYHDKNQVAGKRQSASMSLRFIESCEGIELLPVERES